MSRLQTLREQKRTLAVSIRQLADKMGAEGYAHDPADDANWEKVNADYNAVTRAVERLEAADLVEASAAKSNGDRIDPHLNDGAKDRNAVSVATDRHREIALAAWCRSQYDIDLTAEQQTACKLVGLNPQRKELGLSLYGTNDVQRLQAQYRSVHPLRAKDHCADFQATLSGGAGPSGGYLVAPEQLRSSLEINMLFYGGVRQVAETIRTATGEPMSWPTADDTTNVGVQLGESTSIGTSVDPSFGKVLWSAYKFSSKAILVPYELLQDSQFNLAQLIGQMLGERLGRITNTKYTVGTGAATAKGIITCASAFSGAAATAIVFDDVMGLEHSVDLAYRAGGSYMAHDSILLALRKMKDGDGQPIWQSNWQAGQPDRLNGYAITTNNDMDSTVSSGKKSILFGQLSRYKIRSVGDMRMYRLEERYRDVDQDGFVAFIREDGNLLTAGTAPVKYLSH